jgi:6-phosphogluconolactonase
VEIELYSSKDQADASLETDIVRLIRYTITRTGSAIVALSGGSTPIGLYTLLAQMEEELAEKLVLIQVDERFVDPDHDRSNQKMITTTFTGFSFYPMVVTAETVEQGATLTSDDYISLYTSLGKSGPDISILGMGSDGHTASLFPHNAAFVAQLKEEGTVTLGTYVKAQGEDRISLSTEQINKSIKFLYITGDDKLDALKLALESGDVISYPVLSVIEDAILVGVGTGGGTQLSSRFTLG